MGILVNKGVSCYSLTLSSIVCKLPVDNAVVRGPTSVYSAHEGVCQFGSGRRTGWAEIFHCHHTSEVWLVGVDPSRCSASPRGWALHPPAHTHTETHTYNNNYQHLWSEGISCWPAATAAQYQVYVQAQTLTAFTGWALSSWRNPSGLTHPFFFSTVQGWSHVWESTNNKNRERLLWVTYMRGGEGEVLISQNRNSKFRKKNGSTAVWVQIAEKKICVTLFKMLNLKICSMLDWTVKPEIGTKSSFLCVYYNWTSFKPNITPQLWL